MYMLVIANSTREIKHKYKQILIAYVKNFYEPNWKLLSAMFDFYLKQEINQSNFT